MFTINVNGAQYCARAEFEGDLVHFYLNDVNVVSIDLINTSAEEKCMNLDLQAIMLYIYGEFSISQLSEWLASPDKTWDSLIQVAEEGQGYEFCEFVEYLAEERKVQWPSK